MPVFAGSAGRLELANHHQIAARTMMISRMIAHVGNPLAAGGTGGRVEAGLAAGLTGALAGVAGRDVAALSRPDGFGANAAEAGQQTGRVEGPGNFRRNGGGDRVLLSAEHRGDRGRVGPVGRVLLADRADRRLRDGADRRLGRGVGCAGVLAQGADKVRQARASEEAAEQIGAVVEAARRCRR